MEVQCFDCSFEPFVSSRKLNLDYIVLRRCYFRSFLCGIVSAESNFTQDAKVYNYFWRIRKLIQNSVSIVKYSTYTYYVIMWELHDFFRCCFYSLWDLFLWLFFTLRCIINGLCRFLSISSKRIVRKLVNRVLIISTL